MNSLNSCSIIHIFEKKKNSISGIVDSNSLKQIPRQTACRTSRAEIFIKYK